MDEQIQRVEATLGEMGRSCNTRILERKVEHMRAMDGNIRAIGAGRALVYENEIWYLDG